MDNVITKQRQNEILQNIKGAVHKGMKYPCQRCPHQATSKGNLALHRRAVNEGIKYPCGQCHYQATRNGSLDHHQKAVRD